MTPTYALSNEERTIAVIDAPSKREACSVFVKTHGGGAHYSSWIVYCIHPEFGIVKAERATVDREGVVKVSDTDSGRYF